MGTITYSWCEVGPILHSSCHISGLFFREFAFPLFTFDLAPVKFLVATCLNTQTIFTMKLEETIAQFEQESNHYMVLKKTSTD